MSDKTSHRRAARYTPRQLRALTVVTDELPVDVQVTIRADVRRRSRREQTR